MKREKFGSRLGFILISAGCAIGLGNVWRFPYITGEYGGAAFVLIYLFFLLVLGLPIMVMEFSVGRASQKSAALSFDVLEPKGTKWHWYKYGAMAGNYLLMMFYTTIGGWMLLYFFKMIGGQFEGLDAEGVSNAFGELMGQPGLMAVCMIVVVAACFAICNLGLQKGVEKITKVMMICLLALIVVLAVHSLTLDGAMEGVKFYLVPDFAAMAEIGIGNVIFGALSQAFFTLSIGAGSMTIFGSYLGKDRSLLGESLHITYVLCLPVYCNCGFREYYILFNGQKRLEPWKSCYSQHGGNDPSFSAGSIWLQHFVRNTAAWSRNEHHGSGRFHCIQ